MLSVPFYKNTRDNSHCLQACLRMVLKFYFPDKNYSYRFLDFIADHKKGMWTWQGKSLLYLTKLGFEVINIENLDYQKLAEEGESYLKSIWIKEVFDLQNKYSNLKKECLTAKSLLTNKSINLINREITIKDIEHYYYNNYLIIVSVNPCVFDHKKCYWSHLVLITNLSTNFVTFHDPGLPGRENRRVSKRLFIKAMTKPWKEDNNLIAIRLNPNHPQ